MLVRRSPAARHIARARRSAAQRSVVLACASLLSACHSFRQLPAETPFVAGESVRIEFPAAQMVSVRSPDGVTRAHAVRVVEGRLLRVSGDTLELSPRRLDATGRLNFVRVPHGSSASLVPAPGSSLRVSRLSPAKTAVAVVLGGSVIAAAVLLVALSGMSD